MMKKFVFGKAFRKSALLCAAALSIISVGAKAAPPVDLIVNGGFEAAFAGWTVVNTGSGNWALNNGTFDPPGPGGALPPISGVFDAVSFQDGPGFHALRQTINVPSSGVFSAGLMWNDRVRNHAAVYSDPNQEGRVVFRDVSGTIVHEVFSTSPGDPLLQIGPNSRSGDLTGLFQSYAGQALTVSFEEQDNLSFFNATLDDVRLLVSTLPTDKDECKNGGSATFVNVLTGAQIFKNQGDCVSFVSTKGRNPPANY